MSYYNRYRNKKRPYDNQKQQGLPNGGGNDNQLSQGGLGAPDAIFDLGKNKRVTVRQFRNMNLIDIREYYMDSTTGEMKPGKKGISLTEDLYDELLKHRLNIDEALRRLGSKRSRTRTILVNSDDEDDDTNTTLNSNDKRGEKKSSDDKRSRETSNDPDQINNNKKQKKDKVAPPTLTNSEEKKQNLEREANATLIVPGSNNNNNTKSSTPTPSTVAAKKPPTDTTQTTQVKNETNNNEEEKNSIATTETEIKPDTLSTIDQSTTAVADEDLSSDEEFAKHLDAEMNKADDDVSEEE